jgi:tetrahydromethanopterin S-methyltransferase subunit E
MNTYSINSHARGTHWLFWMSALALLMGATFLISPSVIAGTGGAEFLPLTTWFRDLITGNLGRLIAFAALAVGAIVGVAKLTGMPMGAAFLIAILLVFGVTIIENIVTATV